MALDKEKKAAIIQEYKAHETDTGSKSSDRNAYRQNFAFFQKI